MGLTLSARPSPNGGPSTPPFLPAPPIPGTRHRRLVRRATRAQGSSDPPAPAMLTDPSSPPEPLVAPAAPALPDPPALPASPRREATFRPLNVTTREQEQCQQRRRADAGLLRRRLPSVHRLACRVTPLLPWRSFRTSHEAQRTFLFASRLSLHPLSPFCGYSARPRFNHNEPAAVFRHSVWPRLNAASGYEWDRTDQ